MNVLDGNYSIKLDPNVSITGFNVESKPRVRLEQWEVVEGHSGGYRLLGHAKGHPHLGDNYVRTSMLIRIDFAKRYAETLNTVYELGEAAEPFVLP